MNAVEKKNGLMSGWMDKNTKHPIMSGEFCTAFRNLQFLQTINVNVNIDVERE